MHRRQIHRAALASLFPLLAWRQAQAWSLADLSQADAASGVKAALARGAEAAVALLGQTDGFLGNPRVRIPLPGRLEEAATMLRRFGQGRRIDELVTTMNRAAEQAVPMGRDVLVGAMQSMTVTDAKSILAGGETSVTQFFAARTRVPLSERFLPVVTQSTQKLDLARQYDNFASKAAAFGLLRKEDANLAQYITGKTLDGLYLMIGEEEKNIRRDPVGTGSELLRRVFGADR